MLNATNGVAQRVTPAQKNGWTLGSVQVLPDGRTIYVGPDGLAYASVLSYQRLTANGSHSATQATVTTVAPQVNDAFDLDGVAVLQQKAVERKAEKRRIREDKLIEATKAYDAKVHSTKKETRRAKPPRKRRKSRSVKTGREGRMITGYCIRYRLVTTDKALVDTTATGPSANGYWVSSTDEVMVTFGGITAPVVPRWTMTAEVALIVKEAERRTEPNVRGKGKPGSYADFLTIQCLPKPKPKPKPTQPRTAAKPRVKMSAKQLTARKEERKEEKQRAKRKRQLARKRR